MTRFLLIVLPPIFFLFSQSLNAQNPDKILFGTYIASSNDQKITFHQFGDSNLVKLGFNSIFQTVIHDGIYAPLINLDPVKWKDNRDSLAGSTFGNIMALNSVWNVADPTEKQADWLNILSQGVYNVWEAEGGSDGFYSNIIKMRRNNTYTTLETDAGGIYVKSKDISWSPGSGIPDSSYQEGRVEIELLEGPFIYQDRDYKITYLLGSPNGSLIEYLAYFKMKIGAIPDSNMTVCSLRINLNITDTVGRKYTVVVANREVKSDELSDEFFTSIELPYDFRLISRSYFIESGKINPKTISAVNTSYEVVLPENIYSTDFGELYIDKIEVMDNLIWFRNGNNLNRIQQLLNSYNSTWQSGDIGNVYRDKIKYFYTMDEPHSFDHFLPYKIVEDVQSTLTNSLKDKVMLTKMYPEWNGEKEGLNVLDTWGKVVKPKKFMFWYYTIFKEDFETQLMQHQLRDRLIEAVKHDRDFYFTAQTWGNKKLNDPEYLYYKSPSGAEILGQTIMPLAFGCKGIFYETYYTYNSTNELWGGKYLVEGLVGTDSANFKTPRANDKGLYEMVGNIGRRLKGGLGKTLIKLEYADWSSYVHRISRDNGLSRNGKDSSGGSTNRVEIFDRSELTYPNDKWYSFGVTRLQRKIPVPPYEDFYFFYNANTFMDGDTTGYTQYTDSIKIGLKSFPKKNIRFYNVEGGEYYNFAENLDSNYSVKFEMRINKGDGKLFRLTATVASEGVLQTDEEILPDEIISSEGTITVQEGVTLKIAGNYTLKDSLIIEDGGVLRLEPGSTLNLDSASSVYCAGDIYINGTEANNVTINFLQPNETKQNSIYLGRESSAIIKYAQIKNGYSGITATNGFDTLIIENSNFTNISHAGILLNGAGYDKPLITNNTYTNCDYAGFFSNLSTVIINSDSANTRSGYCFLGVSDLWFGNNKLTGTQEGPGMTLTGCFGNIYNNKITNHTDGILMANSFPKIGGNEITNNTQRGLVCEYGSIPDLESFSEVGDCEQMNTYPLSGYNTIHDNGGEGNDEMNAEIFLDNSSICIAGGTNAVVDDGSEAIIAGKCTDDPLDLSGNYWGSTGVESTTFNLGDNVINYTPQVTTFSPIVSTDCPFIINLNTLSFTDTLHRINNGVIGTGGERAEGYMAEGEYDSAYSEFQSKSLISEDTTSINTEPLRGMYRSGKLANNKETKLYLLAVKTDSLLTSVTDTNALKTLNRLKVYIEADNNNIPTAQLLASQNTTNAITTTDQYHAQTEELTIALRGTTLNRNMKNDVGSITTLNKSGMNNLMKRHGNKFTIKKEPKPVEIITEYSLSQNYPNPFNSSTIIEYALPKEGLVSIKLFDITGRLVKQLVNEQKPTGRHKTTIESGNLASGVYIYSLRVNDININKKLVILK